MNETSKLYEKKVEILDKINDTENKIDVIYVIVNDEYNSNDGCYNDRVTMDTDENVSTNFINDGNIEIVELQEDVITIDASMTTLKNSTNLFSDDNIKIVELKEDSVAIDKSMTVSSTLNGNQPLRTSSFFIS